VLGIAAAVGAFVLAGCGGGGGGVTVAVACDDFAGPEPVHVDRAAALGVGEVLTLRLCSGQGTGFSWQKPVVADTAVLRATGRSFEPPEDAGRVGAPGMEVLTFGGLTAGATSVRIAYSRPWQGGEHAVWSVAVTVTVEDR